jgi:hypothetical protein
MERKRGTPTINEEPGRDPRQREGTSRWEDTIIMVFPLTTAGENKETKPSKGRASGRDTNGSNRLVDLSSHRRTENSNFPPDAVCVGVSNLLT